MARQKQIGGMAEREAVEIIYSAAHAWHRENGMPDPSESDLCMRISEYRHSGKPNSLGSLVNAWLHYEAFTDEGDRRGRIARRAYLKVRRMFYLDTL